MIEPKDGQWLDELIGRTLGSPRAKFPEERWKQMYPKEIESLRQRGEQDSVDGRHNQSQKTIARANQIMKIAASILVVVGVGAGIVWLSQDNGEAGIAFADIVQPFLTARTATYKVTTKPEDRPSRETEVMFMEPGRIRSTHRTSNVTIIDFQQGRAVSLDPKDKTALVFELENMGEDHDLQSRVMLFFDTREYIRKALETEDKTVKYLGKRTIDGRSAVGYQISQDLREMTVWADVTTQSPIRIETSIMLGEDRIAPYVMDHFAFNVELDEALFSLEIPKDYTSTTLKVDASKPSDKDIVRMFRVWTETTDGRFPSALNMAAMEEFTQAWVDKDVQKYNTDQTYKSVDIQNTTDATVPIARGLAFALTLPASSNWHYDGKGVKLGEADRAVFWYRPEGSEVYRVIYGDLSIREMAEEDLPR